MRVEAIILLFLGVFFGIVGLVYWFWSYDDGGGMMLLGTSLLGFLPGSYYLYWHRRMGQRVEDRDDASTFFPLPFPLLWTSLPCGTTRWSGWL